MKQKIGILGSGMVGVTLANGLHRHGHEILLGTNDPGKHTTLKEKTGGQVAIGTFSEAAAHGDIVILAVKGTAAESALDRAGLDRLAGKIVLDATNPIAEAPPVNGVLQFFTTLDDSLMERLQRKAPAVRFVKCFSCVGNAFMVDPDFGGEKPTMFICGHDEAAKQVTTGLLSEIGWDTEDMGAVEAARAIEPLCMLWCIPGFRQGRWQHAFRLLRK